MATTCILVLDYLFEYLTNVIPINLLELVTAISGSFYLKMKSGFNIKDKYFVYFLWFTFFIEVIGAYAPIAYFTKYEYFGFVKDTVFFDNRWLYNIYSLIFYVFFIDYFKSYLQNIKIRKSINILIIIYLIIGILNLIINDEFYYSTAIFTEIAGTFLLFSSIIFFYFNLLNSDKLLNLKHYLPLYLSVGVLIYSLCVTPIEIFSKYFNTENNSFINLSAKMILFANIFMYTTFIIGFLICAKKKTNLKPL